MKAQICAYANEELDLRISDKSNPVGFEQSAHHVGRHGSSGARMILKLVCKDHIYWYNISAIKAWGGEIPT